MSLRCCHGRVRTRKAVNPPEWVAQQRRAAPRYRKFERLVMRIFRAMSDAISDDMIRQAVESGDPGPVLAPFAGIETLDLTVSKQIDYPTIEAEIAGDMLDEVYATSVASGQAAWIALDRIAGITMSGQFNVNNPYTAPAAQQRVGWLISEVRNAGNEGLRQAVADIVDQAYTTGQVPRAVARRIRPLIGLLPGQVNAMSRLRDTLIASGLRGPKLDERLAREANKKLRYRANMIARTEVQRAVSEGRHDAWKDARDNGFFGGKTAYVEWVAGLTERTCDYCADLHGTREPLGQVFISNPPSIATSVEGETPPIHPMCRCTTILVLE